MIEFWKDFDGTNSDSIPHLRVDVNKPSWWHGSWEYSGLDIERIKAYCKATGKEYEKQAINAKFMNEMEEWYLDLAEHQGKVGHWIYLGQSEMTGLKICKCSECYKCTYGSQRYCPNCGRKMRRAR